MILLRKTTLRLLRRRGRMVRATLYYGIYDYLCKTYLRLTRKDSRANFIVRQFRMTRFRVKIHNALKDVFADRLVKLIALIKEVYPNASRRRRKKLRRYLRTLYTVQSHLPRRHSSMPRARKTSIVLLWNLMKTGRAFYRLQAFLLISLITKQQWPFTLIGQLVAREPLESPLRWCYFGSLLRSYTKRGIVLGERYLKRNLILLAQIVPGISSLIFHALQNYGNFPFMLNRIVRPYRRKKRFVSFRVLSTQRWEQIGLSHIRRIVEKSGEPFSLFFLSLTLIGSGEPLLQECMRYLRLAMRYRRTNHFRWN